MADLPVWLAAFACGLGIGFLVGVVFGVAGARDTAAALRSEDL